MMGFLHIFCVFLFFLTFLQPSQSVFEWLFGDGEPKSAEQASGLDTIRFEVLSSDEKFLDFARSLNDMTPLDACYNVVIFNLKKKCGDLNEEELGKLSVQLLNCQSEVEDRPVYPCTAIMKLEECTKAMDGHTWNSYHIVGNRARAVCYATQQHQFRKMTEATVNKLALVAGEQVKTLSDLKAGQEQLHSLTSETVRKLYESQQDLLSTQLSLREAHEGIFSHIAANVKEIMQEKALIASGNQELAAMTENIKDKLDLTAKQIQQRELVEHKKHERILQDLKDIQDKTEASVHKLDSSLQNLLSKFEQLDQQYSGLSASLGKMNVTMSDVMTTLDTLGHNLDKRISWISELLDGNDNKLSAMSCCLLHIAYFFLVAVLATYLQLSIPTRLSVLTVIVGNVAAELNYGHSFDFAGLTVFLFLVYFGYKLVILMGHKFKVMPRVLTLGEGATQDSASYTQPLTPHEVRILLDLLHRFTDTVSRYPPAVSPLANGSVTHDTGPHSDSPPRFGHITPQPSRLNGSALLEDSVVTRRHLLDHLRGSGSRSSSRSTTPVPTESRSSTPSGSTRCQAITVTGAHCRLMPVAGTEYCRIHTGR